MGRDQGHRAPLCSPQAVQLWALGTISRDEQRAAFLAPWRGTFQRLCPGTEQRKTKCKCTRWGYRYESALKRMDILTRITRVDLEGTPPREIRRS